MAPTNAFLLPPYTMPGSQPLARRNALNMTPQEQALLQMARAGDRIDLDNGVYQSIGPNPPPGPYDLNSGDWIKMLPPADARPDAPHLPPEYWRRLRPGFPTS